MHTLLQMDLSSMIAKSGCECLNESDEHPLAHALNPKGGFLQSDCDEQVLRMFLLKATRIITCTQFQSLS